MNIFGKKEPPAMPAWHPDFRDPATLPDVKPVRTSFFINGVAALILAVVALYFAVQEYGRYSLRGDIQRLEQTLAEHRARHEQALKLHRGFETEERLIGEVAEYLETSLPLSELLVALSETLHPGMAFSLIRFENLMERGQVVGRQLLINGAITATPDEAAGTITSYLNAFHDQPFLAGLVSEAVPTSLVPAPEGGRMAFGIQLTLKDAGKKEEKK